jgi:drug/metabolite transporter (DMT)-like permease
VASSLVDNDSREGVDMSSSNLIRWAGLAAILAGVLLVVADLLNLAIGFDDDEPFSESATTGIYALQSWANLLGAVLLLIGLVGLYARQSETAGPLGLAGFLVAFLGTALVTGLIWASLFIVPNLAVEVPAFLDEGEGPPPGFFLSLITFALGWLLFGIATLRARVFPRAAAILLMIGAVIAALPLPFTGIVLAIAMAWLGFALFTGREAPAEQPSRVS